MTYLILAFIAVILLLAAALAIAVKVAAKRGRSINDLKAANEFLQAQFELQQEYQKKKEEAQQNADEKKETLHTGDDVTDFNNSLGVLHNAGKNQGG